MSGKYLSTLVMILLLSAVSSCSAQPAPSESDDRSSSSKATVSENRPPAVAQDTQTISVDQQSETPAEQEPPESEEPADFLIRLDGTELKTQQLVWLNPRLAAGAMQPQMVARMSEYWLETQLLAEEARGRGLDKDEQGKFLMDFAASKALAGRLVNEVREQSNVTEETIKKYYEENKEQDPMLKQPQTYTFTHIHTETVKAGRDAIERIKQGEEMADVARDVSTARDAQRGGVMQKIDERQLQARLGKEVYTAVTSAPPGDIVGPITARGGGFEVIRLDQKVEAHAKPFDEVKDHIRQRLARTAQQEVIQNLLESVKEKAQNNDRVVKSEKLIEAEKTLEQPTGPR